jgi:hypothetical protein
VNVTEEIIRQEISDLHSFIEPMVKMCSELRDDHPVFSSHAHEFFSHIKRLGNETLAYLRVFPEEILSDSRTASSKRQRLLSLRAGWEGLHEYLRPALDADSLHLPTPLITALHDRLHEVADWSSYHFTVFHSAEANYFEVPSQMVREVADKIAALIGGTQFPPCLGLVGIPYSQVDRFFSNVILAHEMGHFIYQECASHDLEEVIDSVLENMENDVGTLEASEIALCKQLVSSWAEEMFCDLFAISQIGPAFSFAFSQLVTASLLIGRADGEPADFCVFAESHPAVVNRFYWHRKLLERLGWWQEIHNWSSSPVLVLQSCRKPSAFFTVELEESPPPAVAQDRLLKCHEELCAFLIEYFLRSEQMPICDLSDFKLQSPIISQYLQRAIVPSTIVIQGEAVYPKPVVLINAAYRFLLEEFSLLLSNIEGEDPKSIESRSRLTARLELWLLKALEDHRLLTRQRQES